MSVQNKAPQPKQEEKPVEQPEEEIFAGDAVLNGSELTSLAEDLAEDLDISDSRWTAPGGVYHGHGPGKHDIRDKLNVRGEFVAKHFSELGVAPNDHAALWAMYYNKNEFINSDEKIFTDAPDDCSSKWSKIVSRKEDAPISDNMHKQVQL